MEPKLQRAWWVYIVECADGTLYTGITPDLDKRIKTHNAGLGAKYTKPRLPVTLRYSEKHPDKSVASKREYELKQLTRKQKKELLENFSRATN